MDSEAYPANVADSYKVYGRAHDKEATNASVWYIKKFNSYLSVHYVNVTSNKLSRADPISNS